MSDKYIIRNCPNLSYAIMADGTERNFQCGLEIDKYCQGCTDCVMKQIVELCRKQKVINCNIEGKEQVLKAYYHTHLGDKILELLDIQEVE